MTEWQIEEPKGNEEDVARWRQSRTKFELHVLKGNLDFDVSQELRQVRVEVKKHSKESSKQDEEDQDPFQIVDARIIDPQFRVDNAFDENPTPSDQAEQCGNVSESHPPGPGRFEGQSHCRDEEPEVPEKEEVETHVE